MTEIRFYHLKKQTLDQALPQILDKAFHAAHRIVVRMESNKEVERMNTILWAFKPDVFLPHGSRKDGHAERQPIWLTDCEENPNHATMLILTQGMETQSIDKFGLCCEMLDGHNAESIEKARTRWKTYSDAGHTVTYWYQDQNGKWNKKAG